MSADNTKGSEQVARTWLEEVLGKSLEDDLEPSETPRSLGELLRDGTLLCEVIHKLQPALAPKQFGGLRRGLTQNAFLMMNQISMFVTAGLAMGVPPSFEFMPVELYEQRNMKKVVAFILALRESLRVQSSGTATHNVRSISRRTAHALRSAPRVNSGSRLFDNGKRTGPATGSSRRAAMKKKRAAAAQSPPNSLKVIVEQPSESADSTTAAASTSAAATSNGDSAKGGALVPLEGVDEDLRALDRSALAHMIMELRAKLRDSKSSEAKAEAAAEEAHAKAEAAQAQVQAVKAEAQAAETSKSVAEEELELADPLVLEENEEATTASPAQDTNGEIEIHVDGELDLDAPLDLEEDDEEDDEDEEGIVLLAAQSDQYGDNEQLNEVEAQLYEMRAIMDELEAEKRESEQRIESLLSKQASLKRQVKRAKKKSHGATSPRREEATENPRPFAVFKSRRTYSSVADVGVRALINAREEMQDTYVCIDKGGGEQGCGFFAVYDGHAGMQAASFAALSLHSRLIGRLHTEAKDRKTTMSLLEEAYELTDTSMRELGIVDDGCTAVTCLIRTDPPGQLSAQRVLYYANVGDSHFVIARNGKAERLSTHHHAESPEEQARVKAAGGVIKTKKDKKGKHKKDATESSGWRIYAKGTPIGMEVTRTLGDHSFKHMAKGMIATPATGILELQPTDTHLILATDGLWDFVRPQMAVDMVLKAGKNLDKVMDELTSKAIRRGSTDNITVVVVDLRVEVPDEEEIDVPEDDAELEEWHYDPDEEA